MLAVQPPSVYEVGGPSTAAAEGPSFPLPAPGLPVPLLVIKDLSTHLGNLEYGHGQLVKKVIQMSGAEVEAGTGGSSYAAKRHADSIAADYGLRDEQPGELTDAVHFEDG
ncbi:hypothetical protein Tco_0730279 [Tanacetum coccineum]|uniref:Uncharacterized protein n=1 Tax=Tanacetum coccineum TaxID=301880 RepID=A0ABQ4YRC4_9ASTR